LLDQPVCSCVQAVLWPISAGYAFGEVNPDLRQSFMYAHTLAYVKMLNGAVAPCEPLDTACDGSVAFGRLDLFAVQLNRSVEQQREHGDLWIEHRVRHVDVEHTGHLAPVQLADHLAF